MRDVTTRDPHDAAERARVAAQLHRSAATGDDQMCLLGDLRAAASGARWFAEKRRDGRQQAAVGFFLAFTALDHVPRVAIENPVGIMSRLFRLPDQVIQPWQFGHPETKATCLWLKGLTPLVPTDDVSADMEGLPDAEAHRVHHMAPGPDRARLRGRTYAGVARAMASQWTECEDCE